MFTPKKEKLDISIQIQNPIFIVGCGHSGNSLMLAILGNHPSIYPIPYESQLFYKNQQYLANKIHQFEQDCHAEGKSRYAEKTPRHIHKIGEIISLFPKSKIILMLRDGRDVVCSLKARGQDFTQSLDRWINDNLEGKKYFNHPNVSQLKYEDLVKNPEQVIRNIFTFTEEKYDSKILEYHTNKKQWFGASELVKPDKIQNLQDHKNLRNWQVNQPIFNGSGRWKKEMSTDEKECLKKKAQTLLEEFGYENDSNW